MRKTLLATLGATLAALLVTASTAQIASAAERHHTRKAHVTMCPQFRCSNYVFPSYVFPSLAFPSVPAPPGELVHYSGGWWGPLGHSPM